MNTPTQEGYEDECKDNFSRKNCYRLAHCFRCWPIIVLYIALSEVFQMSLYRRQRVRTEKGAPVV
jgi:hypothetical protein